jgi:hypothetical protein
VKAFLENFAAILGAATITLLLMSISHEYGYFWSVGNKFQALLTTTDYLSNGVLWLPLALLFVYNWGDWWRFKKRDEPKRNWKKWTSWIGPAFTVLSIINVVALFSWPVQYWVAMNLLLAVVVVWSYIWEQYLPSGTLEEPLNHMLRQAVCFGPPLFAGMFLYGSVDAQTDLAKVDDPYIFQLKNDTNAHLRIFLRNFDKGVLVRDVPDDKIEFMKWEDVVSISKRPSKQTRYPVCVVFGLLCSPVPPPP